MQNFCESSEDCPISIISGADDRFAMGLAVTLYSALANLDPGRAVDFYIIDGGISNQNRHRLTRVLSSDRITVRLKWLKPNCESLGEVWVSEQWGLATYFRLLAPELLPTQLNRVIYLDSDLVVEGSLAKLWEEEFDDCPALAVQDYWLPYVSTTWALHETYQELGLPPDTHYCNSGVIVMNLKHWREENLAQKALEYVRKYQKMDQEGINAVMAGKWKLLDPRWNVQIWSVVRSVIELPCKPADLLRNAFILHFTAPIKPWHPLYRQAGGGGRFAHYLRQSNWFSNLEYMRWFVSTRLPQVFIFPLAWIRAKYPKSFF
ncbi:MAG: glycosyltransferase family 8 protein [Calothrix sp. FI2-JRJ7]|jgi:lipopolysaccharide biosynthesis glycosyltransferase|nr:glycosyltransferase family 8 protein [Calothrix sp. FI2-JRJ7]